MAFSVTTDFLGKGIGFIVYHGSFSNGVLDTYQCDFQSTLGDTLSQELFGPSNSFQQNVSCPKDINVTWRAHVFGDFEGQSKYGSYSTDKTKADAATFPSGLIPGTPTTTTCPVSGSVIPNTNVSSGTVTIEYRVQGTGPWLIGPNLGSFSGTNSQALAGTLTALSPNTTYEARYHINRNTDNLADAYSAIGTFTTQASVPTVIGPPVIEINPVVLLVPNITSGTKIVVPLFGVDGETVRVEMPLPGAIVAPTRVFTRIVLMSNIVERDFEMSD